MSESLYTIRNTPKIVKKFPSELQIGRKITTVKYIIPTKAQFDHNVSEMESNLELEMSNLSANQDTEIQVRERARGSKLGNAYEKKRGTIIKKTPHTVTMRETNKQYNTTYSKREIARRKCVNNNKREKKKIPTEF